MICDLLSQIQKYDFEILNRDFNFLKMYIKEKDSFFKFFFVRYKTNTRSIEDIIYT